ncbi:MULTISPECIES: ketopantoate reductase family protein [Paraliobacillus]|uniref:ketopantoate reductase family protein n=1 Tax=Paraliobacillus TaxID=200903 RepID=UPI000DD3957A|nr:MULTISPECIES: ketopantoate reductase family protein [Paraliobacillus]
MQIKTVSIIGLGALGIMYAAHFTKRLPRENVRIIADQKRIDRYQSEGVYCNGEYCDFHYVTPEESVTPADLIIFTVKYSGLSKAINAVYNQVGKDTIILSALNGISSEAEIGNVLGHEKVLYCVAQGMDAIKEGNKLTYQNKGMLCFGEGSQEKIDTVAHFFDQVDLPYQVVDDMIQRQWGKFMLNVGVNQTVAVYQTNFKGIHEDGAARDTMIAAMREVMTLSEKEGVYLTEADLTYWLDILSTLNPEGKPSLRQDTEAKRYSEVELFSGTVIRLGEKHNIATPVNRYLYQQIIDMEKQY